jgi:hypothetical protein
MYNQEYLQKFLRAKEEVEKRILDLRGVHGLSVGFKTIGGQKTEDIAIVVHVLRKLPIYKLSKDENVVEIIKQHDPALIVDVVESTVPIEEVEKVPKGQEKLFNDQIKYRPLLGGCRIAVEDGDYSYFGTGGCIIHSQTQKEKVSILTNYHVVNESKNNVIYQPYVDITNRIGIVGNFAYSAKIDSVEISLDKTMIYEERIIGIGSIHGTKIPMLNDLVKKHGYKTGLTFGKLTNIAFTGTTAGGKVFTDQLIISKTNISDPRLSDNGDSGSVWVLGIGNKVVALHWGGGNNGCKAYASPINFVESELNVVVATE